MSGATADKRRLLQV